MRNPDLREIAAVTAKEVLVTALIGCLRQLLQQFKTTAGAHLRKLC